MPFTIYSNGNKKKDPGSAKSRIYAEKSTKRGFSKKALERIEIFFLFYVPMNISKAWNAKLEAGIFLASKYVKLGHLFLLIYDIDLLTVKEFKIQNGLLGKVSAVILKGISALSSQRLKR